MKACPKCGCESEDYAMKCKACGHMYAKAVKKTEKLNIDERANDLNNYSESANLNNTNFNSSGTRKTGEKITVFFATLLMLGVLSVIALLIFCLII